MLNIPRVAHEAVGHALQTSKQRRHSASVSETLAMVPMAGERTVLHPNATTGLRSRTHTPAASAPEEQGRRRGWEDV